MPLRGRRICFCYPARLSRTLHHQRSPSFPPNGPFSLLFPTHAQLYHTSEHQEEPAAALDQEPILVSEEEPPKERQIEALNAALAEAQARERQAKEAAREAKRRQR